MAWNDPLTTHLLDFLFETKSRGLTTPLTIAGGFGLFLKRRYLAEQKERTLFNDMPGARSTEDIDIFVRAEILRSEEQSRAIPATLRHLGYEAIVEFMQWKKLVEPGYVKIDFLTGSVDTHRTYLKLDKLPRVRNKQVEGFHAYLTPEAILVNEQALKIPLKGRRSSGEEYETTIFIPHPFTYLVMKLFAFHDRQKDEKKQHGSHHAFDLFSIIGSLTEREFGESIEIGKKNAQEPSIQKAKKFVNDYFTGTSPSGMVVIKKHNLYEGMSKNDYEEFLKVMKEIFGVT